MKFLENDFLKSLTILGSFLIFIYNLKKLIKNKFNGTPIILIKSLSKLTGCNIYAKCEFKNKYTSKDRLIRFIIEEGIKNKKINNNTVIYEGSSGSVGYSVSAICKELNIKSCVIMPENCNKNIIQKLKKLERKVIWTKDVPYSNFSENYLRMSQKISSEDPNGFYINQYNNKLNILFNYKFIGHEIYNQLNGKIDYFVCCSGTGGTISGVSKYLKEKNNKINIVLCDIEGSGLLNYVNEGVLFSENECEVVKQKKLSEKNSLAQIKTNFLPKNIQKAFIDDLYKITEDEAVFMQQYIYINDNIKIGLTSAVNLVGILKLIKNNKKNILFCKRKINFCTILFDNYDFDENIQSKINNITELI